MDPKDWAGLTPSGLRFSGHRTQPSPESQASHLDRKGSPLPIAAAAVPEKAALKVTPIVSLAAAHVGLLVMPLVLGPAAIVAGIAGVVLAVKTGHGGGMSAAGILLGLVGTFIGLGSSGLI